MKINTKAFTLIEILIAFAILTSAIIPVVIVIEHYSRQSNWNEEYSFALSYADSMLKNISEIDLNQLKKIMKYEKKVEFSNVDVKDVNGKSIINLKSFKHMHSMYFQKIIVRKIFPEFLSLDSKNGNKKFVSSQFSAYKFTYKIYWKNKVTKELNFEYVKTSL